MQITFGKSVQHTSFLNSSTQSNVTMSNVSQKIDGSNIQKPLSTDPNIVQRFENVQKISNMIKSLTPQNKSMMMRLDPPNLGSVEVRLITRGKEVLVNFIVKDSDLKDVIKNSSQLLTTQLKTSTNYQKIQINVQSQDNQNQQFHQRDNEHNQQEQNKRRYYQQDEEEDENDS
jgi:flagellar hook-length control protein FliK